MRFGPVPLAKAEGAILAHSVDAGGRRLRKGLRLGADDVAALGTAGHAEVVAARLDPGDLGEDAAAARVAAALAPGAGLRLGKAATGRVNVHAEGPGVLEVDAPAVDAANRVDPMITIATLAPFARAGARAMVATVKVISYGVREAAADEAARLAKGALRLRPVILRSAALIMTDAGGGPGKGDKAMRKRVEALGMDLAEVSTVPHRAGALAEAIRASRADLVMILTASATSDPRDVAPEAVRAAGGRVDRFGMPVDPGNLLVLGRQGGRPVIGLPGCARSPALNGADWVLERVACGVEVTDADIAGMGVGGLLKEPRARPHPREGA